MKIFFSLIYLFLSIQPIQLIASENIVLRGIPPEFELLGFQLNMPHVQTIVPGDITLISSTGSHYTIHSHEIEALSHLAPTIGDFISDWGPDFTTIPLDHTSNQTLEFLIRILMGVEDSELIPLLQELGPYVLGELFDEANFLQFSKLKELILRASNNDKEGTDETTTYATLASEIFEDDFEDDSSEEDSAEDILPPFETTFPDFGDLNAEYTKKGLRLLEKYATNFKGRELLKIIRVVHHQLIFLVHESDPTSVLPVLQIVDRVDDLYPNDPESLNDVANQFLIHLPLSSEFGGPNTFREYTKDKSGSNDKLVFALQNKVHREICPFEGLFGEIFCKNKDIENLFSYLSKSFEDYRNSEVELASVFSSPSLGVEEKMALLGTKDVRTGARRFEWIVAAIKEHDGYINAFRAAQPSLMSLFLVYQHLNSEQERWNRFITAKPSARLGKQRCAERKAFYLGRARYMGLQGTQTALLVLKPFADYFLQLIGETPRAAVPLHPELRECAMFHLSLREKASTTLKTAQSPKRTQATATKKRIVDKKSPALEAPTATPQKRERRKIPEPEVKSTTPLDRQDDVSSFFQSTETKSDKVKREPKPIKKSSHQKTKGEREQERAQRKKEKYDRVVEEYRLQQEERAKKLAKFKLALSPEEAALVMKGLNKTNRTILKFVFAQPSTHLKLTDKHFILLAKGIQEQINLVLGRESSAFINTIEDWIHPAHDSTDTGDLLPGHYVDVLRMVFIIFGVIPEGWEPKTREDRAIVKLL